MHNYNFYESDIIFLKRPHCIEIKCEGQFKIIDNMENNAPPTIRMRVTKLIDNEFFMLDYTDYNESKYDVGPKLVPVPVFVKNIGRPIYPSIQEGYEIEIKGSDAHFTIDSINFEITSDIYKKDVIGVILDFSAIIPNDILINFNIATDEFNAYALKQIEEAKKLMKYIGMDN
jgi:hypothetical protein